MITRLFHGSIFIAAGEVQQDYNLSPAVNPAKTMVKSLGSSGVFFKVELISSTTVRASRTNTTNSVNIGFEVVEFD